MEKKKRRRFMQRMVAAILALFMIAGMMLSGFTVEAHSNNGGYPYNVAAGRYIVDPWNFYQCECTSFVAWCLNARNGVAFHNYYRGVQWGNAKNWGNAARQLGIAVDGNPAVGAVAWSSSGSYGHVAWVCAVNGDNVTIDEYNYGSVLIGGKWYGNHKYNTRTVHKSAFQYIHLKDIPQTPPTPVGNAPKGDLNNAEGGTNTVRVRGWAFDPDAPGQELEVHVYIGGPAGAGEGHGGIIANVRREDVNNVFGVGIYHGFDATIRTSLSGTQKVYVYAINVGRDTGNPQIGEKTVTISKDATAPTISDVQVVDKDVTGYTVTCRAEDAEGIAKVQFPTWTALNDQDDLAEGWWDNPNCRGTQDGTTWSFRVNDKDHSFEHGIYRTHIYAWDNNGNATCYELNNIELQNTYSSVNAASYNGHTYHLYNDILTWKEAKEKCEELGGHLVTITSAGEQEVVAELIQGQARNGYWIGGRNDNGSTWVTGEEFSFSNWSPGEPNADGGEDSYELYPDGTWNDLMGSSKYLGFICEWEKLPHTHNYEESAWKSDAESHWKECECGERAENAAHQFTWIIDQAATEESEGIKHEECGTCGYKRNEGTVIEKLPSTHTHDYSKSAWKSDAEKHWKECECGEKAEESAHAFAWVIDRAATEESAGVKHEECEACGYKRNEGTVIEKLPATHTHDYSKSAWKTDAESHWKECECGEKAEESVHAFAWVIDQAATEESTGIKHEECKTCGYKRNEGTVIEKLSPAHTHDYSAAAWKMDAEKHWKECECGEKAEESAHAFAWVIDRAATEESAGVKHEECETCGCKRSEGTVIEKLPTTHTHDYSTAAWKTDGEKHWKECECGEKAEEAVHAFAWVIDRAATEESEGLKHEECETCGYRRNEGTVIEKIPADHTHCYDPAWKTDAEKHWKECECGDKSETAAHSYTAIVTQATTTQDGSIVKQCQICGQIAETVTISHPSEIILSKTSYIYNGKEQQPSVTIKDGNGNSIAASDYEVTYTNNKAIGTAGVEIALKGNYSGAMTASFTINPKGTSVAKLTASAKGFSLKWKKQAVQTNGYEIQYSTSKKFAKKKTAVKKVKKKSQTKLTVKKLKAKKKYYVRIRTYKTVKGKKYYSNWSKAKTVKTKK